MTHKLLFSVFLAILFGCASAPVKPKEAYVPLRSLDKNVQSAFLQRLPSRLQTKAVFSERELDTLQFIAMAEWTQTPSDAPKTTDYPLLSALACMEQDSSIIPIAPIFPKLKQNSGLPLPTLVMLSQACPAVSNSTKGLWLSDIASQIVVQSPTLSASAIVNLMGTIHEDSLVGKMLVLADSSTYTSIIQQCKKTQRTVPCLTALNSWPVPALCLRETIRTNNDSADAFDIAIDARIRGMLSHQSVVNPIQNSCILKDWRLDLEDSAFAMLNDSNQYWLVVHDSKFPTHFREKALEKMQASNTLSDSLLLILLNQEKQSSIVTKALEPKRTNKAWLLKTLPLVGLAPAGTQAALVISGILNASHNGWKKAKGVSPNVLRMENAVETYQKNHEKLAQNPVEQVELAKAGFVNGQVQRTWEMSETEKAEAMKAREIAVQEASAKVDEKAIAERIELKTQQAQNVLKIRAVIDSEHDLGWKGVLQKVYGEDWYLITD